MSPPPRLHYGWIVVVAGALVLFACLGLARYAYTMLLPGMRADLGLAYDQLGFIGTGNFAGYLLSVLCAPLLLRHVRPRPLVAAGLVLIGSCMLLLSRSDDFAVILPLYALVGAGGGLANIPLMTIVPRWFRSSVRGKAVGLVIGGNGAAIVFGGLLIPAVNRLCGPDGWRTSWLLLGLIAFAVAGIAALLLRNDPAELGLDPVGPVRPAAPQQLVGHARRGDGRLLIHLGLLYFAFGATFMVYGTFIVASMVGDYGFSEARAGLHWSWVGLLSAFSGVVFGALSDRIGRRHGLALVFAAQTAAYLLVGLRLGHPALLVSIACYGLTVFAIPTIMTAAVADYLGLARAANAFATVTVCFALGQTLGPGVAGLLAKSSGSFASSYLIAALVTAGAAGAALLLPPPPQHQQ